MSGNHVAGHGYGAIFTFSRLSTTMTPQRCRKTCTEPNAKERSYSSLNTNGVVVVSFTKPTRSRIGRLVGSASLYSQR